MVKVILNPELLKEPDLKDKLAREKWQTSALAILETLKKNKSSKVFHEPVNWQKMNLFDYPTIVKEPMDFSTIKKKLIFNVYGKVQEFIHDLDLVFSNCKLYNGVDSYVGKLGVDVNREWETLQKTYNLLGKFGAEEDAFELDKGSEPAKLFEKKPEEKADKVPSHMAMIEEEADPTPS